MASNSGVIVKDPQIMGGIPVFSGTRVPFQSLLDYIEGGQTLDEFLADFPTVKRDAAIRALEHAKELAGGTDLRFLQSGDSDELMQHADVAHRRAIVRHWLPLQDRIRAASNHALIKLLILLYLQNYPWPNER